MPKSKKSLPQTTLSSLEALILTALARFGPLSPYRLFQTADMHPGSTIPALKRLAQAGLIEIRRELGSRRESYSISPAGRSHLRAAQRDWLARIPDDTESALRAVVLTLLTARDARKGDCAEFLRAAAEMRQLESSRVRLRSLELHRAILTPWDLYRWMRAEAEADRLDGESSALSAMSAALGELSAVEDAEAPLSPYSLDDM